MSLMFSITHKKPRLLRTIPPEGASRTGKSYVGQMLPQTARPVPYAERRAFRRGFVAGVGIAALLLLVAALTITPFLP